MIITPEEVTSLSGKFIVEIDSHKPDTLINNENWGFMKEKRISFVCGLQLVGFYYMHLKFNSSEEFANWFNDNVITNYTKGKNERFHRLLTSSEIDFVCKKLKEENY